MVTNWIGTNTCLCKYMYTQNVRSKIIVLSYDLDKLLSTKRPLWKRYKFHASETIICSVVEFSVDEPSHKKTICKNRVIVKHKLLNVPETHTVCSVLIFFKTGFVLSLPNLSLSFNGLFYLQMIVSFLLIILLKFSLFLLFGP